MDQFTLWQDAIPIPVATTKVIGDKPNLLFSYFGMPEVHSDQGAQFQSDLMEELCGMWGESKP